jgi:hypothetical protein
MWHRNSVGIAASRISLTHDLIPNDLCGTVS